jgi:cell pole-organizing protein PopZ
MTDTTAQEPTMEEILASIRRIISEDDAPAAEATPAPAPVEESPALMDATPSMQEPEPEPQTEEEILDLTDRYEAPTGQTIGDLEVSAPADEPEPEPFPTAFAEPEPVSHDPAPSASSVPYDSLVGESASAASASAFAGLAASFRQPDPEPVPTGGVGPTIDDLARALLRPMLKDWLDANLPGIVEAAVKKEVERIARNAG